MDDRIRVPTLSTKNRGRLLTTNMPRRIMAALLAPRAVAPLLWDDHASVDGTLVKASAVDEELPAKGSCHIRRGRRSRRIRPRRPSNQSTAELEPRTRPTRRNRSVRIDFRGGRRSATHASMTDPDAGLSRKSPGVGAMPCCTGHSLMENRFGLIVEADLHVFGTELGTSESCGNLPTSCPLFRS